MSGTINYLAKFITSDTVGNSVAYESSSQIGIGTSGPTRTLDVNGSARIRGDIYDSNDNKIVQLNGTAVEGHQNYLQLLTNYDAINSVGYVGLSQQGSSKGKLGIGVNGESSRDEAWAETGAHIDLAGHIEGTLNVIWELYPITGGVNFFRTCTGETGAAPVIAAVGPATNIDYRMEVQNAGNFIFGQLSNVANGQYTTLKIANPLNSVNYLTISGGASGTSPSITATGAGTNLDISLLVKGSGTIKFLNHNDGRDWLTFPAVTSTFSLRSGSGSMSVHNDVYGGNLISFYDSGDVNIHGTTFYSNGVVNLYNGGLVSFGAQNSAGSGYRTVRVPNI